MTSRRSANCSLQHDENVCELDGQSQTRGAACCSRNQANEKQLYACWGTCCTANSPELLALRLCLLPVLFKGELPAVLQGIQPRTLHERQTGPVCAAATHGNPHASWNHSINLAWTGPSTERFNTPHLMVVGPPAHIGDSGVHRASSCGSAHA